MNTKLVKRYTVLGILFFLPVAFLLMLLPAKHNYNPLDIVETQVSDLQDFASTNGQTIQLKDHITVLVFLGNHPMENAVAASNLKELVYDKFKGFKKFQVVVALPNGAESEVEQLKKEIHSYEELKYWQFVYGSENAISQLYNSLKHKNTLTADFATTQVFIVDKDLNQRGRLDDRTDDEKATKKPVYDLVSYNALEIAEIKDKLCADDLRVLFQEYREKRKGNFDSSTRRANNLKAKNNE
ncbi:MAG: hypothetical protein R2812_03625 [Gelidibacter sp.]